MTSSTIAVEGRSSNTRDSSDVLTPDEGQRTSGRARSQHLIAGSISRFSRFPPQPQKQGGLKHGQNVWPCPDAAADLSNIAGINSAMITSKKPPQRYQKATNELPSLIRFLPKDVPAW